MNEVLCPKCGSDKITANRKGFSTGKATAGSLLTGSLGGGILAGGSGANKIKITCLACGNEFRPGEGAKSKEDFEKNKALEGKFKIGFVGIFLIALLFTIFTEDDKKTNSNANYLSYPTAQTDFLTSKNAHFKSLIESESSANKIKNLSPLKTNELLKGSANLNGWVAKVISVDIFDGKTIDLSLSIQDRKIVGSRNIVKDGKSYEMKSGITIELLQIDDIENSTVGIDRNSEIGKYVKTLKSGDIVKFDARIKGISESTEKTGLNLSSILYAELETIQRIND